MAILAILVAMAAPTFTSIIQRSRVDSARDALAYTIQLARTEAIRTGQQINIAPQACAFDDWGCGWVMYTDLNLSNTQDLPAEPTIRQFDAIPNTRITKTAPVNRLSVSRFGQSIALGVAFQIGPRGSVSGECRSLVLNSAMRQTSITGANQCPAP